ncbi:MAG TPA: helix-turn-helix domain-containing protein [Atribacteraceae bacterium]|nr:helix-turn-helix domain-containing protein [Atribacteraceae bacterium]
MNEEGRIGIGETLKRAREEKGLSLQEVETRTFVLRKHLEALEEEKWKDIPGSSYALGYLKIYSKFLQLDEAGLVERFKKDLIFKPPDRRDPERVTRKPVVKKTVKKAVKKARSQMFRKLLTGLVVATVFFIGFFFLLITGRGQFFIGQQIPVTPTPDIVAVTPTVSPPTLPEEEEILAPEPEVFVLNLRLIPEDLAWLEVRSAGRNIFTGILIPGKEYVLRSHSLLELSGRDGDRVRLVLNEQEEGLLAEGGEAFTRLFRP